MTAPPIEVNVGNLRLPVPPGDQADPAVPWNRSTWDRHLRISVPDQADRLLQELAALGPLNRQALYHVVDGELALAHLAVVVWGLGTTGHFRNIVPRLRRALAAGESERLANSRSAAGRPIGDLWDAHFGAQAPEGLGSTSYGTKWLHAVGWTATPSDQPRPLVYDEVVWSGLTGCAGLEHFKHPRGRQRTSWLAWCELAHQLTESEPELAPSNLEYALFRHAGDCPAAAALR